MLIRTDDIFATIEGLPQFREAATVLAYWSIGDEIPTQDFLSRWYGRKRLVLPAVLDDTRMELREYVEGKMHAGRYGIAEPDVDAPLVDPSEVDFAIVPGRQFDHDGNRRGHGKGYYDRMLAGMRAYTVGIADASRIVPRIDARPWDVPVKLVISGRY